MGRTNNGSGVCRNMMSLHEWGYLWHSCGRATVPRYGKWDSVSGTATAPRYDKWDSVNGRATAPRYDRWDSLTGGYRWRQLS